jgi:hypothetical protein
MLGHKKESRSVSPSLVSDVSCSGEPWRVRIENTWLRGKTTTGGKERWSNTRARKLQNPKPGRIHGCSRVSMGAIIKLVMSRD